jgi:FkbM family methyltransferase
MSAHQKGGVMAVWAAVDRRLNQPYYLFRPSQVVRRATLGLRRGHRGEYDQIISPWGLPLTFRVNEKTGLSYARRGIFDLPVCEVLWRLLEPGELAVDVGANIGQMTSAMASAVGAEGRVIAFEPHPELFRHLAENADRWNRAEEAGSIEPRNLGASSATGVAELGEGEGFGWNTGTASMQDGPGAYVTSIRVPVRTLDQELGDAAVGVLKVDVEGHELEVLRGAERLLSEKRIRDVVFEDFDDPPTPVTSLLESFGYSVFSLDQAVLGPTVGPAMAGSARRSRDDPSYLATVDPDRALERLKARGWGVLGRGPYRRRSGRRAR